MKSKSYLRHILREEYNEFDYDFETIQPIYKENPAEVYNILNKANPDWMELVLTNQVKRNASTWDSDEDKPNNAPQYIYRSSKGYHDNLMLCHSPENRGSLSMDMTLNNMVDDLLKKRGCVALRKNSAFGTNSMSFAKQFGGRVPGLRIIIPVVGKFHTTYLSNIDDLYVSIEVRLSEVRYCHDGDVTYLFDNLIKIVDKINKVVREDTFLHPPVYTYSSLAERNSTDELVRKLYKFCSEHKIITALGEEAFKKHILTMNEAVFFEMVGEVVKTNNSKELYEKLDDMENLNKRVELYLTGEYYAVDIDLMTNIVRDKIMNKF